MAKLRSVRTICHSSAKAWSAAAAAPLVYLDEGEEICGQDAEQRGDRKEDLVAHLVQRPTGQRRDQKDDRHPPHAHRRHHLPARFRDIFLWMTRV